MIAKDFHFTKDFRQIRGKSFVIKGSSATPSDLSVISGSHDGMASGGPDVQ
jgi:hypothetical protein